MADDDARVEAERWAARFTDPIDRSEFLRRLDIRDRANYSRGWAKGHEDDRKRQASRILNDDSFDDLERIAEELSESRFPTLSTLGAQMNEALLRLVVPVADAAHSMDADGLCNYRCTGCGWRYAHVGRGNPDDVAWRRWGQEHRAAPVVADDRVRALATYAVTHRNMGECPEGPDDTARDPECQVCQWITAPVADVDAIARLLRDLVDDDDCWFDHNGGCQAHGYISLKPGEICPQAEAKSILARLAGTEGDRG